MKKTMIAVLLFISILQAGITFGTGSRVFIYDANISVYGNLKNLGGVITPVSTSKFTFVGSAQDTITNITTFPNLAISKPSGSVRLNNGSGSFTITGSISFTGGNVITGTNTFELGTTATVTGESTAGYIVGTVRAARSVGAGTNTFGGIGYSINNTGADLGTVTVYRYSGEGNQVTIYGSPGILRRWAIETSNPFSGTRQVTASWLSGEDNGNVLANLKAWKYVAAKDGTEKEDNFKNNIVKSLIKKNDKLLAKSNDREKADDFTRDFELEEDEYEIITEEQKTLGWVEIDGATFNTAGSPRTATFSMDAVTSFTINDTSNLFADGAGTASNPYQIATLDQLNAVRYYPSACFIQIADIDASATSTWNSGSGWEPLGSSGSQFTGNYNGQGYDITGLYINRSAATYVGLFGYANGATISNVELYSANVTGGSYTGGLIGYQTSSASVENCLSDGTVAGTNYVGGLVGYIRVGSSINNSLSKGQVSANTYIGGLIGRIYSDCDVMNSYSMADVIRNSGQTSVIVGGFIGQNYAGSIINSYSTGSVTYDATTNPTDKGFAGTIYNDGIYYNMTGNFWNTETSGQLTSVGATGLTKNQMRTLSTFTNATWDFQDESVNGVEDVWGINAVENSGYPFLSWEGITHNPSPFAGGIGTSDEPFLVSNLTQLDAVRNFLSYNFLQTADIDASPTVSWNSGSGWDPIGTSSPYFTGTYDGAGHLISDLYFNRTTNYTGLFGVAYTGSVIKNLGLKDVDANGYNYSGTISGYTNGVITNCYSTGSIRSFGYIGGFVGYVSSSADVNNCYSTVNVTRMTGSASTVNAGFAGYLGGGSLVDNYSTGSVTWEGSSTTSKGFLGSFSSGTMTGNFWNTETSGQTSTSGTATGLSIAEMSTMSTITSAGWDFYGESANGTDDYWNMHTSLNSGFPYLNWEYRLPVEAPANLALSIVGTDVIITWDPVTDAAGYLVYSSEDPYGVFTLDETGAFAGEQWTGPFAGTKMFYYVTAINDTKVIAAKTININGNSNR
ncbi:MAG: GLUG motif-containing protein [Candidatus Delongbacteria bacterium]|jgi:hypothetical protein|nr:GLUG motif-containing protein [Candidatus Delongbacteria bacterium]